ncbi:MAG: 4-hydroxy-tetrahydrodipicolinate synthase [Gammaproteobacteria bacterium TMED95]|nr:4-hydroxy-tetrahydrodipicolinate synthase [Rhodobiaceae bacterium]OUV21363.1 MAG: 4-hydroxy-tetrahydrodipicolinate synthase [Gammaproteobacteria bacterium TMED95]RPF96122.1 MAG: 4-hydroxy-tetrahydrodipicolinate synthase [Rhizobiales bacterium TMED162]
MFRGAITALITPFKNGALDEAALQSLVDWQITEGIHGLVPVGTTGESPTLSHAEHERAVEVVIEAADKRVPIIAGAGSNATAEAIAFTQHAEKAGADAVLHVTPYYNKPTQDGMVAHFTAIAENTALPIILYNIPGRSVIDMTPETMGRLAEIKNIVGVKDATSDMARIAQQAETCSADFIQLSGEDASAVDFNRAGGAGVISVCANIAPAKCAAMQQASLDGEWDKAEALLAELLPLMDALFCETSPSPAKYAMARMGKCAEEIRLPLLPASEMARGRIDAALVDLGL